MYRKGFRPVTGRKPYCAVVIPPLTSYEAYAFICVPCNVGKPASPTWFRWQLRSDFLLPLLVPGFHPPRLSGTLDLAKYCLHLCLCQLRKYYTESFVILSRGGRHFCLKTSPPGRILFSFSDIPTFHILEYRNLSHRPTIFHYFPL